MIAPCPPERLPLEALGDALLRAETLLQPRFGTDAADYLFRQGPSFVSNPPPADAFRAGRQRSIEEAPASLGPTVGGVVLRPPPPTFL